MNSWNDCYGNQYTASTSTGLWQTIDIDTSSYAKALEDMVRQMQGYIAATYGELPVNDPATAPLRVVMTGE